MSKITKLTPEQQNMIPVYLNKWLKNGRRTDRLNREKSIEAVKTIYKCAKLKEPQHFFFFSSPLQCQLAANIMNSKAFEKLPKKLINAPSALMVDQAAMDKLSPNITSEHLVTFVDKFVTNFTESFKTQLNEDVPSSVVLDLVNKTAAGSFKYEPSFFANYWVGWVGFYDYILNELFPEKTGEFDLFLEYVEAVQNVGGFIPYDNAVLIFDNPVSCNLDAQDRLHNENGAALMYEDGYSLFHLNGVTVPKWAIETPRELINPKDVLALTNTEQRMVLMRHVGLGKFLKDLNAEEINSYKDYKLYYLTVENVKVGPYLFMTCPSSGRQFLEGCGDATKYDSVDPTIKTCQDALEWRAQKASQNLMTKFNLTWDYQS